MNIGQNTIISAGRKAGERVLKRCVRPRIGNVSGVGSVDYFIHFDDFKFGVSRAKTPKEKIRQILNSIAAGRPLKMVRTLINGKLGLLVDFADLTPQEQLGRLWSKLDVGTLLSNHALECGRIKAALGQNEELARAAVALGEKGLNQFLHESARFVPDTSEQVTKWLTEILTHK